MNSVQLYPNRKRAQASSGSTSWRILGLDGAWYASHQAALTANTEAWPGVTDFPRGIPRVIVQTLAASGNAVGSEFQVATNTLVTPTTPDIDAQNGEPVVLDDAAVKSLWVKQTVTGDLTSVVGWF
jgi:hypothetical protein